MSLHRVIIQGKLDFANQKSYEKAKKMYEYRLENYCKSDSLFKDADTIFFDENFTLEIPRFVGQAFEKTFKNTTSLFEYCAQFALSGVIKAWQTESGKILNYKDIEPQSDKIAVIAFQKGKKLSKEKGQESNALVELSKAIEKYDRHAQAYERRGNINIVLKKYAEATRDFKKSIGIDSSNPMSYYGLSRVNIIKKEYQKAIDNLEMVCKKSLALQAIYWIARRTKADCHYKLEQFEKAEFDLKLFTNRFFREDNSNFGWRRHAFYKYGLVLVALEKYAEAIPAFQSALEIEDSIDNIPLEDIYYYLGSSKKKAGKNGYVGDLKKASEMGSKSASRMLVGAK
jgi:tetratricopeptide (TPR) repeat protein